MNTESSLMCSFYKYWFGKSKVIHYKDNYFKGKTVLPSCKYNMYEPECEQISQTFYLNVKLAYSSSLFSSPGISQPITTIWRRPKRRLPKMCDFGNCNIKMNNKGRHTVTFAFNSNLHSKY